MKDGGDKKSSIGILLGLKPDEKDGEKPEMDDKESSSSEDGPGALHDAAQAMLDAIKADDVDALVEALHTAHILCSEE